MDKKNEKEAIEDIRNKLLCIIKHIKHQIDLIIFRKSNF